MAGPLEPNPPSSIFLQADEWFTRARAALLNALPCSQGCCRCCIGPFAITSLDVQELQRGLAALAPEQRQVIELRARQQLDAMERQYPQLATTSSLDGWDDGVVDDLVVQFADIPCPALQADGSCGVYANRPITCRTMGIPTDEQGLVQGACEVQTAVPLIRLSRALREEEDRLAEKEAVALSDCHGQTGECSEEVLLQYGFVTR